MSLVEYKVGELCSIKHGWAFAGEFFSDEGDHLLLTPGNAYMSGGIKIRPGKEKFYIGEFPKDYLLKKGDILLILTDLVQEAPLLGGSITIPEDNYFLHNQRLGLVENVNTDLVDRRFLYHLFNSPLYRGQVRASASGATVRHTAPGRIYDCSVTIPKDLATQKNISYLLDSIDELVENNNVIAEKLDEILSSTYQEWFINFKFPNHEQVEFVDGIPEGWVKKTIFACYEILSGGTPKTTNPLYWENGKIPFFTPKDATDSYFVNETEKYITEDGLSKCNSKLYDEKTIFITARGTVGKIAIPMRPMAMNQSCYALKPNADLCFYYSFLNIEDAINKIKQNANGGVFDAIVVDTFKQIDVLVPHMEIQVQFENLVQPMFEQIKNLLKQNEHLLDLKHTLLPRLMSGELDVSKLSSIE